VGGVVPQKPPVAPAAIDDADIPVADDLYDEWLVELEKSEEDGTGRRRQR